MNKRAYIYRAIIASARTTAVVVANMGMYYMIFEMRHIGNPYGVSLSEWEKIKLLLLIGYTVFALFPIGILSPKIFRPIVGAGYLLALGSACFFYDIYVDLVIVRLEGQFIYHVMAWILLIPVYSYIPVLLTARRMKSANQRVQPTAKGSGG